ncbi:hypothetical protein HDF26_000116 [Pedobacter cryoconitis]|uniref:DUF4199 domain-containing protein n=1 Tax=Pedobacter cryoconitis TaxID=188932 RepID=A0A7W8ZS91_9SPHI|nr:DUF4199 domain-containing protein [Pedobacter cryoconitis]MBB5639244.1 hypothetical protein [Pedobacter cryoconitis]MBB6269689.1 hypothetical protein [Pedobacter cryoconitis]
MEQQLRQLEIKPNKVAFQAAIAFSLYTLALVFIFKLLNIDTQDEHISVPTRIISMICSYVPFILAILYAQTRHKTELGGYITFGRAFSAGFKVAAYSGLFIAVLFVLYYKVLDPTALDHAVDMAVEKAGDNEKAAKGAAMMKPYLAIFIGFGAAMTYTIFGLVLSLIGAAILKKENPAV